MARSRTKHHVRRRLFLNRDPMLPAYVIGVVQDTREIPNDKREGWRWTTVDLTFGDCNRRVTFDFCMDTRTERTNALSKINRLAEVVNAVRDAIELEVESLNARPKLPPEKKKPKSTSGA